MNLEEIISVGKCWLWMTVFSTCLFASCGETNRTSQDPISPELHARAVPAIDSLSQKQSLDTTDPNAIWKAFFEATVDPDDIEPDLSDDFE